MAVELVGGNEVRIVYLGMVRRTVGLDSERESLDGAATLGALLTRLADRHGEEFRDFVFSGRELSRLSTIVIGGLNCLALGGLDAPLSGGSEIEVVVFGPPASGG